MGFSLFRRGEKVMAMDEKNQILTDPNGTPLEFANDMETAAKADTKTTTDVSGDTAGMAALNQQLKVLTDSLAAEKLAREEDRKAALAQVKTAERKAALESVSRDADAFAKASRDGHRSFGKLNKALASAYLFMACEDHDRPLTEDQQAKTGIKSRVDLVKAIDASMAAQSLGEEVSHEALDLVCAKLLGNRTGGADDPEDNGYGIGKRATVGRGFNEDQFKADLARTPTGRSILNDPNQYARSKTAAMSVCQ